MIYKVAGNFRNMVRWHVFGVGIVKNEERLGEGVGEGVFLGKCHLPSHIVVGSVLMVETDKMTVEQKK